MKHVLVIAGDNKERSCLLDLLKQTPYRALLVPHGAEAKAKLADIRPSLIIIASPLSEALAKELSQRAASPLLLIASEGDISFHPEEYGMLTLKKPFKPEAFFEIISSLQLFENFHELYFEKNRRLQKQIAESKTIFQAKCLLIEQRHMTEPQAHRFIEKTAMDTRQTKLSTARSIIDSYKTVSDKKG